MTNEPAHEGKELRLAFAMGGGVSLGTFSGAALSECVKQCLLEGVGSGRYSSVSIDVFSGASAGAVSLLLMLRSLADRSPEQIVEARRRLRSLPQWDGLSEELQDQLSAADIMQDLQRRLWVDDLDMDALLNDRKGTLRFQAALFNRESIDDLARKYLSFSTKTEDRMQNVAILAPRVLFACTLSNLTPIIADGRRQLPGSEIGYAGLTDALTSGLHREIRVFDIHFSEVAEPDLPPTRMADGEFDDRWPSRWCRYHMGPARDRILGDLRQDRSWSRIAGTALAAAAFPFAFEPVALTRSSYEYGNEWPAELRDATFRKSGGEKTDPSARYEYPFTYVDGGVFNNDPLREAFKLAAYMDARSDPATYVRRVIYVDPDTMDRPHSFAIPSHRAYHIRDAGWFGLGGKRVRRASTLHLLEAFIPKLAGSVLNEARADEENRAGSWHGNGAERSELRALIRSMVRGDPQSHLRPLAERCRAILDVKRRDQMIPPGPVTLHGALQQTIYHAPELDLKTDEIEGVLRSIEAGETADNADKWMEALSVLAFRLLADSDAEFFNGKVVAIAPIENPSAREISELRIFELPGKSHFGFAGFMSKQASTRDFNLGLWCARNFLWLCDVIDTAPGPPPPLRVPEEDAAQIARHVRKGERRVARRLSEVVTHRLDMDLKFAGFFAPMLMMIGPLRTRTIAAFLRAIPRRAPDTYEFRVYVPNQLYELEGPDTFDSRARPVYDEAGRSLLITLASRTSNGWEGVHISRGALKVFRRRIPPLQKKCAATLALPEGALFEQARILPNPIFEIHFPYTSEGWRLLPGVEPLDKRLL